MIREPGLSATTFEKVEAGSMRVCVSLAHQNLPEFACAACGCTQGWPDWSQLQLRVQTQVRKTTKHEQQHPSVGTRRGHIHGQVHFIPVGNALAEMSEAGQGDDGGEAEGGMTALQTSAAAVIPAGLWSTHCSRVVFSCKRGANGLMPIRPQVVLTSDVDLGAGKAVQLF